MASTGSREEDDNDWNARHARTKRQAKRRVVRAIDKRDDDWDDRHAETKRGA